MRLVSKNFRWLIRTSLALLVGGALVVACHSEESDEGRTNVDDDGPTGSDGLPGQVTWHEHIAPLVQEKCLSCHNEGGIAPFVIETYDQAKEWASSMQRAISDGTMPPWGAQETDECESIGAYRDDIRLSAEQKELFSKWITDGRLEGDVKSAPEFVQALSLTLPEPSRSLSIPSAVTVEGTSDEFVCFTLDPQITEPVWLTGSQIQAGNSAIVHHALVFRDRSGVGEELADDSGQYPCFGGPRTDDIVLISAWAPGAVPATLPNNTGTPLEPGDKLVMQVHYHPTGQGPETDDSTQVDLKWTTEEPDYVGGIFLIGNFDEGGEAVAGGEGFGLTTGPDFMIPAGATDHQEVLRFFLDDDDLPRKRLLPLYLWAVGTHMHYVGTDMKITATSPNGDEQCLVHTPQWDFNWQRAYAFEGEVEELPVLHAGDTLTMRCTYDNSLGNPFVREALDAQGLTAPQDVLLGEETLDEMCLGVFGFAIDKTYKSELGF